MVALAIYGIVFFGLLMIFYSLPISYRRIYYTAYTFIEYSFFTYIITLNLKTKAFKKLILIFSFSFLVFQIFYFLTADIKRLDSLGIGIETILLFIYIILFFYDFFNNPKVSFVYNHYCFWVSLGILIYLGSSFFFNILANHMTSTQMEKYWSLTLVTEFFKNLFLVASIIIFSKQPNQKNRTPTSVPYLDFDVK